MERDSSVLTVLSGETAVNAFERFAIAAEQIAATSKRLTKAAVLGEYFTLLEDEDLRRAARYFAGSPFPLSDQRVLNVGGSALMNALLTVSGTELSLLQVELVQRGDLGDVARSVLPEAAPTLRLSDVAEGLATLVETRGNKRKVEVITQLLQRATPVEAKYLIKLMTGDLRIGLKEGAMEDAIARLAQQKVERIQWVNMLTGDIGETAVLARHDQLDTAHMRLFHPLKFMLASPVDDLAEISQRMPEGFAVEDKYDGIRAQVHIAPVSDNADPLLHGVTHAGVRVALFSRTLDETTHTFPDLVAPLAALPRSVRGRANFGWGNCALSRQPHFALSRSTKAVRPQNLARGTVARSSGDLGCLRHSLPRRPSLDRATLRGETGSPSLP